MYLYFCFALSDLALSILSFVTLPFIKLQHNLIVVSALKLHLTALYL